MKRNMFYCYLANKINEVCNHAIFMYGSLFDKKITIGEIEYPLLKR